MEAQVTVVGAGLAGSEAAWQLAKRGIRVRLVEMKPAKMTPAHVSPDFAELVCSNSFRSDELSNAVGLLKEELRRLDSLIMRCADAHRVPAGGALAVDRVAYARMVTETIRSHPNIELVSEEVTEIPDGEVIIASGPLPAMPSARPSPAAARTATCTFTMRRRPSSALTALIWTAPSLPPAMTRERRIMSTVQ